MDFGAILQYYNSPEPFIAIFGGVILGYFVGAVPGLSRPTALAIAIPFTYTMSPLGAISLLLGIAKGSAAGGAIAAILINVPGEPGSAATTLDGYPMAKKGEAGKALQIALYSSVFGDVHLHSRADRHLRAAWPIWRSRSARSSFVRSSSSR